MPYLLRGLPFDTAVGALRPHYLSDQGFTTTPADTPANTYWRRRIETPLRARRSLWNGTRIGGRSTTSFGAATAANDDGLLDGFDADSLDWTGRQIDVWFTKVVRPTLADFGAPIFSGAVERLVPGDTLTFELRDLTVLVDKPASRGQFGGTGGIDGPASMKAREKPWLLGRCRQVAPVLIDAQSNIFMFDPLGFRALLALRDKGVTFPTAQFAGDFADYAALKAAALTGTQYATCKAQGLIRTASAPVGTLTADVEGLAPGGVWIHRYADMVEHLAVTMAGLPAGSLDAASLTAMRTLCPAVLGYWYDGAGEAPPVPSVIDALSDTVGAYWGFDEDRLLAVGRYDGPAAVPDAVFGPRQLLELVPRATEHRLKKQRLGYARYWTTLDGDSLDTVNVTDAQREDFPNALRWAEHEDPAVAAASLLAREEEAETFFDEEADAKAECVRRVAVFGPKVKAFDVTVPLGLAPALRVGRTVMISDPRFGLAAGRRMVVLETDRDADAETLTMTVLG